MIYGNQILKLGAWNLTEHNNSTHFILPALYWMVMLIFVRGQNYRAWLLHRLSSFSFLNVFTILPIIIINVLNKDLTQFFKQEFDE